MTKADLIEKMAKDAGISKVAAKAALESFVDGVTKGLKKTQQPCNLGGLRNLQEGLSQDPHGA